MHPDTPSRRLAAVAALTLGPVLTLVWVALQPELTGDPALELESMAATAATVSAVLFLASQLPLLVAVLAIGRLVQPGAPRLSAWGTALSVLGCFGHTAFGGIALVQVVMARDVARRDAYVALVTALFDSPVMVVAAIGTVGFVLGTLVLAIAIWRTRTGPVWVGPVMVAFLVVEFGASGLSEYAGYASVLLLAAAFWALADVLRRGPAGDGQSAVPTAAGFADSSTES